MMRMVHPSKGNTDFKEGAKLLEMETSSESDQEHFVLPASKKGPRKRKAGKSSGCCSSGPAVVAVVSTVAILLCVLILAPFIYQLKKDVDSLRKSTCKLNITYNNV
ncbi:hypothetical protein LSAT2_007117 [Lamellibrachia satsuma]|nr:hypothetical protein LSAT2_007117 [Lamellibrachia satsuma]